MAASTCTYPASWLVVWQSRLYRGCTAGCTADCTAHMAALYRMYITVGLKAHTRPLVRASSAAGAGAGAGERGSRHRKVIEGLSDSRRAACCITTKEKPPQPPLRHLASHPAIQPSSHPASSRLTRVGQAEGGGCRLDIISIPRKHRPLLLVIICQRVQQAPQRGVQAPGAAQLQEGGGGGGGAGKRAM